MQTSQFYAKIVSELNRAVNMISDEDSEKMVSRILESNKIFVGGAGRSGFMGKSFAMRMMHMGLDSYVIGETVTPNFTKQDLLILGSGSGETKSLISLADKAKNIGGTIVVVTIFPNSSLGMMADIVIRLPGSPKEQSEQEWQTIQPMASLFEQTLLLFYDAVILRFMEKKGLNSQSMFERHANLE